ncbi:hypothetical protein PtB15_6B766 [Puccinia triticina]|nr:hypothetical protein PtB15_6B766 [Puccinia triticina]
MVPLGKLVIINAAPKLTQTAIATKDFCIFAPPRPLVVGDAKRISVSYCSKDGYGTRLIPPGTFKNLHFVRTPHYVQITALGNFTKVNVPAGDEGGELGLTVTETQSAPWSSASGANLTIGPNSLHMMNFASELALIHRSPPDFANTYMTWKDVAGTCLVTTTALDLTNAKEKMSLYQWVNTADLTVQFSPGNGASHLNLQMVPLCSPPWFELLKICRIRNQQLAFDRLLVDKLIVVYARL